MVILNVKCKYYEESRTWKILIQPKKAVEIKQALDNLEGNNNANLKMTMKEIESYLKAKFDGDIFNRVYPNNVSIFTRTSLRNDPGFYEILFCQVSIYKQSYSSNNYTNLIKNLDIDENYFNENEWENLGWDGEDRDY